MQTVAAQGLSQDEVLRLMEAYLEIEQGRRGENNMTDEMPEREETVRVKGVEVIQGEGLRLSTTSEDDKTSTAQSADDVARSRPEMLSASGPASPTTLASIERSTFSDGTGSGTAAGSTGAAASSRHRFPWRLRRHSHGHQPATENAKSALQSPSLESAEGDHPGPRVMRGIDGRAYVSPADAFYAAVAKLDDVQRKAIMETVRSAQFTMDEAFALVKSFVAQQSFEDSKFAEEAPGLAATRLYHTPEGSRPRTSMDLEGSQLGAKRPLGTAGKSLSFDPGMSRASEPPGPGARTMGAVKEAEPLGAAEVAAQTTTPRSSSAEALGRKTAAGLRLPSTNHDRFNFSVLADMRARASSAGQIERTAAAKRRQTADAIGAGRWASHMQLSSASAGREVWPGLAPAAGRTGGSPQPQFADFDRLAPTTFRRGSGGSAVTPGSSRGASPRPPLHPSNPFARDVAIVDEQSG